MDVVADGIIEQYRVLWYDSDGLTDRFGRQISYVCAT